MWTVLTNWYKLFFYRKKEKKSFCLLQKRAIIEANSDRKKGSIDRKKGSIKKHTGRLYVEFGTNYFSIGKRTENIKDNSMKKYNDKKFRIKYV